MKPGSLLLLLLMGIYINIYGQNLSNAIAVNEKIMVEFVPDSFSPQIITNPGNSNSFVHDPAYYLQKSKVQKRNGLLLVTGGSVLSLLGIKNRLDNTGSFSLKNSSFYTNENAYTAFSRIAITGVIMMAGSIPYFISALKNKYKAGLKLTCQKNSFGASNKASKKVIGLTYAIPIGK